MNIAGPASVARRWPRAGLTARLRRGGVVARTASSSAEPARRVDEDELAEGPPRRSTSGSGAAHAGPEDGDTRALADGDNRLAAARAKLLSTASTAALTPDTAAGGTEAGSGSSKATLLKPSPALSSTQQRINAHIQTLQAQLAEARKALASRAAHLSRRADAEFGRLGGRINEVTGYREVEAMKVVVVEREHALTRLRDAARAAKEAYDTAVTARSDSQREVTSLLERKHAWTDADVAAFTTLVRRDHASNLAVSQAKLALAHADLAVEQAFDALMKGILERYHEEQVWSDKIRSVSTYGSLVVLGINLVVFLGAIIVVEPWKRRRLVRGLEERMTGLMSELEGKVEREVGAVAAAVRESRREGMMDSAVGAAVEDKFPPADDNDSGTSTTTDYPAPVVVDASPPPTATPPNRVLDTLHRLSTQLSTLPGISSVMPSHETARDTVTSAMLGAIGGGLVVGCGVLAAAAAARR